MTEHQGWRSRILNAARSFDDGDQAPVNELAALLREQDCAKEILRKAGYGCVGMRWLEMVDEILNRRKA